MLPTKHRPTNKATGRRVYNGRPRTPGLIASLRSLDVLTVGQVANLCRTSPRTVAGWIDSGVLHGYRLPGIHKGRGGRDRRVPRESLIRFMRDNGFHLPTAFAQDVVLLIGLDQRLAASVIAGIPDGTPCHAALTAFDAGLLVRDMAPAVVVIDLAAGRAEGIGIAKAIREHAECQDAFLVAIACEDETGTPELIQAGFAEVFQRPFDAALLVERIRMAEV